MSKKIDFGSIKAYLMFTVNNRDTVGVEFSCAEDMLYILEQYNEENWGFLEPEGFNVNDIDYVKFDGIELGHYSQNSNSFRVGFDYHRTYGSFNIDVVELEANNAEKLEQIKALLSEG